MGIRLDYPAGEYAHSGRRDHFPVQSTPRQPPPTVATEHAALLPLRTAPGHVIRLAQQLHERIWLSEVGAGLTSIQYGLLLALSDQDGLDQRSIGEAMSLDKSTGADVVLRLGRKGMIVRYPHPDDGRRKVISITATGETTLLAASPGAVRVQQQVMSPLLKDEQETCLAYLRIVAFRGRPPRHPRRVEEAAPLSGWPAALRPLVLHRAPGHLIRRAQQVHTLLWSEHVGLRITSVQFVVLLVLDAHPGIAQKTLGEHASLDKSTVGEILARLVARGLVRRTRDLDDGRHTLLHLTPSGQTELRLCEPAVVLVQKELLRPLPLDQGEQFLALLSRVAHSYTGG